MKVCTACQMGRHARCMELIEGFLCDCENDDCAAAEPRPMRYKAHPNPYKPDGPDPYGPPR